MSWQAIRRAYEVEDAKCKSPSQLAALLAIAHFCGNDMKGCYASQETLAAKAHMSVKSFQRQRDELVDLGLIVPGDESLVAKIRADRRPDVWNLGCTDPIQAGRQIVASSAKRPTEERESEPVPRGDNLSVNGATNCRTNLKSKEEPKNLRAPDAAHASSSYVDASHRHVPPPAGQRATESSRTKPAKRKRLTLNERLDAYLAELGPEAVDAIYCEFVAREERLIEHFIPIVRAEQGYPEDSRPHDEGFEDEFARKVIVAAILTARKPNKGGYGQKAADLLAGFDWEPWRRKKGAAKPDGPDAPAASLGASDGLPPVTYRKAPPGTHAAGGMKMALFPAVDALDDSAALAKLAQMRAYSPKEAEDYQAQARSYFANVDSRASVAERARMAIKYGIGAYSDNWPMYVDPTEPVDLQTLTVHVPGIADLIAAA
jgi:hypothetical protein